MPTYRIPANGWRPREYQRGLWRYFERGGCGGKRAFVRAHRRWGKDEVLMHRLCVSAFEKQATYWHMLPEATQARKAIWDAVNPHTGKRRIDEIYPTELRSVTRENEMFIRFINGSGLHLVGSDSYNCYSEDTEILTKGGWLLFSELKGDELVATLDAGDELVYTPINAIISNDYVGEMYRVSNNAIDLLTTPNHRFYVESGKGVRKFKQIDDPTIECGYKIPATCSWRGVEPDRFALPVIEYHPSTRGDVARALEFKIEDWCAFMGIFLSEGSTFSDDRGNYRVVISQKKPSTCADIDALLTRMELPHRYDESPGNFIIGNKQLFAYCQQFGLCHQKYVPADLKELSPRLLGILMDWLVKGDGCINSNNTLSYASTSKRLADDFQELLIKTGLSGNISVQKNDGGVIGGRKISSARPLYRVNRRLSKFKYFRDTEESYITREPYAGRVWCVDAGSHIIKVRRNGKEAWCGNSLVGSPPYGVVFSEWALAHPAAWAYISPILRENGGWAAFISTPRGKNHFWRMEQMARNEGWFVEAASAEQTGAFSADDLAAERREMIGTYGADMGAALFEQEYLVSYEAAILGSYYGAELARAEREGRIAAIPVDPALPVHTAWDLGVGDSTAIWFWQATGRSIRIVDYYEAHGEGLKHYAAVIKAKRYRPGVDWVPHDAKVREFVSDARTRIEAMIEAGLRPRLVPDHTLEDGIQAVRATLPRCAFDGEHCADGIEALKQYAREFDEKTRSFRDKPRHDWASHCADAFRYLALAWREEAGEQPRPSDRMLTVGYNPDVRSVRLDDLWEAPTRRERERV